MAKDWDVRAYALNGDIYCSDCIADTEEATPVFESDESPPEGEYCGQCGECVGEPYDTTTLVDVLRGWSLDRSYYEEEAGDASDGIGWGCLFLRVDPDMLRESGLCGSYSPRARGAEWPSFIFQVDSYGFKYVETFDTDEEALAAWKEVAAELEPEEEAEEEPRDNETGDLFAEGDA